uniref:Ribosomal RNA-processing protein 14/surfeit locus protein 6 C-terminal domain-containing protein n=2 Tax=Gouania willdenowi TaxID=441366 RepID=A0A8C5EIG2_GOUWI
MDLTSKDNYMQKLASKLNFQRDKEPKRRPFVHFKGKSDAGPPKKRKTKKKNHIQNNNGNSVMQQKPSATKQTVAATAKPEAQAQKPQAGSVSNFSTVNVLRKRLHEKIEESRGQGTPKNPSSEEVQAKRAKRKLERERKKRKRKEFLMKKLAEQSGEEIKAEPEPETNVNAPKSNKRDETAIIFNKVEMVEDRFVDKMLSKQTKKQRIKGQITPLTGKNYKQLLSRVEARKAKVEQLREKDEEKALELEKKIKWTNVLYKAEGLKIKDNGDMLRTSLKNKEKRRSQRKKQWNQRSESTVEKMQHRQDKRKRNLKKRQQKKVEKKKNKARKKGRVLPEDLKKAA